MKLQITPGAYGWRHAHWLNTFYPADLPEDWQLTYYSNEFNTVMVPADYWQIKENLDCADWPDAVHQDFKFFVECRADMLGHVSLAELTENLINLGPMLSALVFLGKKQQMPGPLEKQFVSLIESLEVDVFGQGFFTGVKTKSIWQEEEPKTADFAWIENDLTDLRLARKLIDDFAACPVNDGQRATEATIIVNHPRLQASDLSKFRSLLEIMGY